MERRLADMVTQIASIKDTTAKVECPQAQVEEATKTYRQFSQPFGQKGPSH